MNKSACNINRAEIMETALRKLCDSARSWEIALPLIAARMGASSALLLRARGVGEASKRLAFRSAAWPGIQRSRGAESVRQAFRVAAAHERLDLPNPKAACVVDVGESSVEREHPGMEFFFRKLAAGCIEVLPLWASPTCQLYLCAAFGDAHPPLTAAERALFVGIANLCREAMIVSDTLHRESAANIAASFNGMPFAAFVANGLGEIVAFNDAARTLVRVGRSVRLEDGRLEFLNPADTRRLRLMLSEDHRADSATMQIGGMARGGEAAEIAVSRIRHGDSALGFSSFSLIIVKAQRYAVDRMILQEAHGDALTRAELAVTEHLILGRRTTEIARIRQVSVETIRSQMKSIYAKLGVRNQVELMKVLQVAAA